VNSDGASCFFIALIKGLFSLEAFEKKLEENFTSSTFRCSLDTRNHLQKNLKRLKIALDQPSPSQELISEIWHELRFEDPELLRIFPAYRASDASLLYGYIADALTLDNHPGSSLGSFNLIRLNEATPFKIGQDEFNYQLEISPIFKNELKVTLQEMIAGISNEEVIEDYVDIRSRPFIRYPKAYKSVKIFHSDLANFEHFTLYLPKADVEILDLQQDIKLPILDRKTHEEKNVNMRLKAITCYLGKDSQTGHYVTYRKEIDGWYLHDDGIVKKIEGELEKEFFPHRSHIYPNLFFYEKEKD
jgi:hypothetical protein